MIKEEEPLVKGCVERPNGKYKWLKNRNEKLPQSVIFEAANGAKMEMIPFKATSFYMTNDQRDGRDKHKVTITRPSRWSLVI